MACVSGWSRPSKVRIRVQDSNELDKQTRKEWNALGFFYTYDEAERRWLVRADREGMNRLAEALRSYASDPRNSAISEHEHYGPYSYLKFVTWTEAKILADGFYGTPADFARLASIVASTIAKARVGDIIRIDEAYSTASEAKLELRFEPDGFDAASADPVL
jgi:hypothetical protein